MDTGTGDIRELTPEEPLEQGETEITEGEARALHYVPESARVEALRKMRAKAARRAKAKSARKMKRKQR